MSSLDYIKKYMLMFIPYRHVQQQNYDNAFFPFNNIFRIIALALTINKPLLITIDNISGIFTKISGANVAPTPIAILVPIILKLLSAPKSTLDKMEIPRSEERRVGKECGS